VHLNSGIAAAVKLLKEFVYENHNENSVYGVLGLRPGS
jgi:hypothetical protein